MMKYMNCPSSKNTSTKLLCKILLIFIKGYKRYFTSILYLTFYKLLGSKSQIEKWHYKSQQRYKYLLPQKISQIKAWIQSSEFKQKYLNHPYPPLLNPQNLDYNLISADLAWELNLPLPNYDFMYISSGAAASAATFKFFDHCKVNITDATSCKELYRSNYDMFLQHTDKKNCFFSYCYYMTATPESLKLRSLLRKKPLLFVVRDPIERLQHAINHLNPSLTENHIGKSKGKYINNINLTCHYSALFKNILFESDTAMPNLTLLDSPISYTMNRLSLYDTTTLNALKDKVTPPPLHRV